MPPRENSPGAGDGRAVQSKPRRALLGQAARLSPRRWVLRSLLLQGAVHQGTQGMTNMVGLQDFQVALCLFHRELLCPVRSCMMESGWGVSCSWEPFSCPRTSLCFARRCCGLKPPEKTRVCLLAWGKPVFAATPPGFPCKASSYLPQGKLRHAKVSRRPFQKHSTLRGSQGSTGQAQVTRG